MPQYARGCKASTKLQLAKAHYVGHALGALPAPPPNLYNGTGITDWTMGGNGPMQPNDTTYSGPPLGDCVACMIGNGKRALSKSTGAAEVEINAAGIVSWYLNQTGGADTGLNIGDAMTALRTSGIMDSSSKPHYGGPSGVVDWTNATQLKLAIQEFKIVALGVAADQLNAAVDSTNGKSGWVLSDAREDQNIDHCVFLLGFGTVEWLAGALGIPTPSVIRGFYWALYTWGTVGFISDASMKSITGEAHVFVTDPDRGDSAIWDQEAAEDYAEVTGSAPSPTPPSPTPPSDSISRAAAIANIQAGFAADRGLENIIDRFGNPYFAALAQKIIGAT